jgi:O-antigen biosynthesis protein
MSYKPYSIWTPEFSVTSGGIRVMWGLFGWLLAKGQLAVTNATWSTPFTAIYPEITHGNPLNAQRVVRYILNKPGVMASFGVPGPTHYEKEDEIYVFSKIYDTFGVDEEHLLFLPILNLHIFKDYKKKRPHTCYFVGKGKDMELHPKDAIKINRANQTDQQQLADVLNTCSVMYSYENPTAMNEIARLCGCRVIYLSQGSTIKYTREELERLYEPGMDGVNFDKDEGIELDSKAFRKHYIGLIDTFETKLDKFIDP